MIDNDFVYELPFDVDTKQLLSMVSNVRNNKLKKHQHHVEDYPYIADIKARYPILGTIWNFYYFKPNTGLEPHIDGKRTAAVNIPLSGSEFSRTTFYKSDSEIILAYDNTRVLHSIKSRLDPVFEFTLSRPTLIRTDVPHSVIAGNEPRLIISWGVIKNFEESKEFFKSLVSMS